VVALDELTVWLGGDGVLDKGVTVELSVLDEGVTVELGDDGVIVAVELGENVGLEGAPDLLLMAFFTAAS
jgi:hypothetical protein